MKHDAITTAAIPAGSFSPEKSDTRVGAETLREANQSAILASGAKKLMAYVLLTVGAITMVLPFLWMVTTSLSKPGSFSMWSAKAKWWEGWLPLHFEWKNYIEACRVVPLAKFYLNSLFVTVATTIGQVVTSAMAGYAFARLHFWGREKLFFAYLATMMIPGAVTMIPVFILLRHLGWVDTYKALILPGMFTAYGTFMLRQFFLTLPRDLEDAAKIDGCSLFGIFIKIILPLSKPALATLTTFTFMGSWMNFMWPLVVTTSQEKFVLTVGLAYFQSLYATNWTLLMAGSVMMTAPIILLFVLNQRFFVEGIKLSGIKG